ncbi:hypothetical protein AXG93_2528s2230 [Marchantia polymorpha subsp. ruderalis]|uniref:Uncharacterized protein n=1 Tax=Marchantia polymorpha subsp. ruderalis TaxID=1480154 RepID=A0A176WPU7_MARPO|nr:hypothetical protein AXG93_2528s2230 [Marchantia polymorpha subsp. ruderalis]
MDSLNATGHAIFLELNEKIQGLEPSWREWAVGMLRPIAALAVVAVAMVLSYSQKLGLEKEMIYSIARAFIQLSAIGFVLEFIFNQANVAWIFLAYVIMNFEGVLDVKVPHRSLRIPIIQTSLFSAGSCAQVTVAGYTAGQRARNVPNGAYVAGLSIFLGTALTMALLVVLKVFPFTPRYIIPVAGMMVGNAMTVTGVTLKRMREDLRLQQGMIETALALGATPRQATVKQVRRALVVGLSPVLDNAKTVGLISLPGAMTGLIMGGASPTEAIQLQIVVMNMLLGASTFSGVLATYLSWPFFFTSTYQLQTKVLRDE